MRKIVTLFQRDPDNRRHVTREVSPGAEWVLAGEGVATRKYDGICVRLTADGLWWARREVKPGKAAPTNYVPEQHDDVTGKTFGWEPVEQTGWATLLRSVVDRVDGPIAAGTFELCGWRVNGNPEQLDGHVLYRHGCTPLADAPRDYDALATYLHASPDMEGIVWHHPDGRMVKIKRRDFAKVAVDVA